MICTVTNEKTKSRNVNDLEMRYINVFKITTLMEWQSQHEMLNKSKYKWLGENIYFCCTQLSKFRHQNATQQKQNLLCDLWIFAFYRFFFVCAENKKAAFLQMSLRMSIKERKKEWLCFTAKHNINTTMKIDINAEQLQNVLKCNVWDVHWMWLDVRMTRWEMIHNFLFIFWLDNVLCPIITR